MDVNDALRHIDIAIFGLVAAVTGRQWVRRGGRPEMWATFALASVALSNIAFSLPETPAWVWSEKVGIAILVLFPYLILRFSGAFDEQRHRLSSRLAGAATAAIIVWHLLLPPIPEDLERWPGSLVPWVVTVLATWTFLSLLAATRLARAGRHQSKPVRQRLRTLAVATLGMTAGVLLVGLAPDVGGNALTVTTTLSGLLFYLALAPPAWLRMLWRRREQQALQDASAQLIAATSQDQVVESFMPSATAIVGANAFALLDLDGTPLAAHDVDDQQVRRAVAGTGADDLTRIDGAFGTLLIRTSPYAPLFGGEEISLLRALASLVQVAVERISLLERQAELAAIVQNSDDAILAKTTAGVITAWNPGAQKLYGYTAEEAVGQSIRMLIPPDRRGEEQTILRHIMQGTPLDHFETQRVRKNGEIIDVSVTISPIRDASGRTVGASTIARDVSSQKEAERILALANAELQRADALKTQFLAMASHELRTPLTAISGFTSTLLNLGDKIDDDQKREFLTIIDRQTHRLQRLVEDLLTLSHIESGALQAHPRQIEIPVAIKQVIRDLDAEHVTVSCVPEHVTASVDPDHLQQILTNYVGNALKYGAPPIQIAAHATNGTVEIRVSDHGEGVPKQFVPKLFERFQRAADHAEAEGTGLGLSIVRGLAHAQGGDAWYEPNEPTGARFCVQLPATANARIERHSATAERRNRSVSAGFSG